ncbi:MAG: tetratricopeptide repeat protein [Methanobacteriota archaeon]
MSCRLLNLSLCIIILALSPSPALAALDPITLAEDAYSAGNYESAIRWYDEALGTNPQDQSALIGRLTALASLSRWEEVVNGIAGSGIDPADSPKIASLRAEGYLKTGNPDDALVDLDTYPEISDADDLRIRAEALIALKRETDALSLLTKAEGTGFTDPRLSFLTGTILSGEENMTAAIPYLEAAVAGIPHDPKAPASLGEAIASRGLYEEALIFFRNAVEIDGDDPDLWVEIAYLSSRLGRYDEALKALDYPLSLSPFDPDLLNAKAYALFLNGHGHEGLSMAQEVLTLAPGNPGAMDTLGCILLSDGDTDGAIRYLKQAADLLPGDPEVLTHLADAYRTVGRDREAQDLYQRALKIDRSSGKTWLGYAEVMLRLERYPEAASAIAEAYSFYPGDTQLISWEQEADKVLIDWYLKDEEKKKSIALS